MGTTAAAAAIYSWEVVARRRQRTPELAMAPAACHRARKQRKTLGGDIRVASFLHYLQNCHYV